jgi:hypothetical protein
MAKVTNNPTTGDLEGTLGGLVFYMRKGTHCARRRPVRRKKFTSAEKKNQSRFGQASAFAKTVLNDAAQKARYEQAAKATKGSAQNLAVSDFMHAPNLAEIDLSDYTGQSGESIRVRAEEGVLGAVAVKVIIADSGKSPVEQGAATLEDNGPWWSYTTQKQVSEDQPLWITITATDQPGNKTTKTLRHSTGR